MNEQRGMFGEPVERVTYPDGQMSPRRKRKTTRPQGYAARPGTGPEGEACGTCKHICRVRFSKVYVKCSLMRAVWTHGPGTDIRVGSPACRFFEAGEGESVTAPK